MIGSEPSPDTELRVRNQAMVRTFGKGLFRIGSIVKYFWVALPILRYSAEVLKKLGNEDLVRKYIVSYVHITPVIC